MKTPRPVAMEQWARREHFEYYRNAVACTYSVTVELDVTDFAQAMKRSRRKTYIAQVWALATVVNRHEEFRLTLTDAGSPAVWDVVDPMFTVFNPERETFASVWAPYETDFTSFHEGAAPLLAEHRTATSMFPQGEGPANVFDVSSLPWASFTGFNLNVRDAWEHLAPIFTLGKYVIRENRTMLPLAIQIHHAAADGFHTSRLITELQTLLDDADWLG
ncbi:type A chloramphenicol O-acetyltransferase [Paramicrobacterium sp. CJ85]|uniref:type A chloramphenicol O-acetyltransferase n=1 Tax=Paramicrobacterium sp. CJ85 TaxID=3445355 RepID=UPI003F63DC56